MKAVSILAIIIVIGGLAWYFMSSSSEMAQEAANVEMENADEMNSEAEVMTEEETVEVSNEVEAVDVMEAEDADEPLAYEFTLDSFNYGYSEETLRVTEGATVTINLTNSQGFHDWVVDEFNAATEKINAGGETSVTFVASTAGTYEYYCSVGNHRAQGMVGTLIVE